MDQFNVFSRPHESDLRLVPAAVAAIQQQYPDEPTQFLVHFRRQERGLLINVLIADDQFQTSCLGVIEIRSLSGNNRPEHTLIGREIQNAVEEKIDYEALQVSAGSGTYYRVSDKLTGMDIHLYEGRVYDLNAIIVELE